jgi:hypothetical protein
VKPICIPLPMKQLELLPTNQKHVRSTTTAQRHESPWNRQPTNQPTTWSKHEEQRPSMHIACINLIQTLKVEGKGEQINNCSHVTWFGQERVIRLAIIIITIFFYFFLCFPPIISGPLSISAWIFSYLRYL